ncbi:MAG: hypothetical protein HC828_05915 [Blastochloris sp.]|nr:hypothetical protein [Blastochloris sp.]
MLCRIATLHIQERTTTDDEQRRLSTVAQTCSLPRHKRFQSEGGYAEERPEANGAEEDPAHHFIA